MLRHFSELALRWPQLKEHIRQFRMTLCTPRCARCACACGRRKYLPSGSPLSRRRSVFLPLHREEEKPMEFANGSLLGNDSRIFVRHPNAYPLSRTRASHPLPPRLLTRSPAAHFLPVFKVLSSPDTGVLHPLTLLFSDFCSFDVSSLLSVFELSR